MNTIFWVLQAVIAATFMYSGICKLTLNIPQLVAKGQTGVEHVSLGLVRFIGVCEILGAIGIILPALLNVMLFFTVVSATGFALIMVPAAFIHSSRKEYKVVIGNMAVLAICLFIAYGRLYLVK